MPEPIRVVIAEDHPFFRDGLRRALEKCDGFEVAGEAADGTSALGLIRSLEPDVAILDIGLPGLNGFAVVRTLREERRPVAVVFLTVHDDEAMFEAALELDVRGYLLKDCTDSEVARCLSAVAAGHHYTSPSMTTSREQDPPHRTVRAADRRPSPADAAGTHHPGHRSGAYGLRPDRCGGPEHR